MFAEHLSEAEELELLAGAVRPELVEILDATFKVFEAKAATNFDAFVEDTRPHWPGERRKYGRCAR